MKFLDIVVLAAWIAIWVNIFNALGKLAAKFIS